MKKHRVTAFVALTGETSHGWVQGPDDHETVAGSSPESDSHLDLIGHGRQQLKLKVGMEF